MNELTHTQSGAVAMPPSYDPFSVYGQEAAAGGGTFLKFSKGDWTKGQSDEEVALGSVFVANMDEFRIGWIRWDDKKPVERRMHTLISGIKAEHRNELGFDDQKMWDVDKDGKPIDPWQFTNELPLADQETGEQFTFSTSSKGGISAIGNLCKAYGKEYKSKEGLTPVVELGVDKYKHSDSSFGWIKVPVLKLVSWVSYEEAQLRKQDQEIGSGTEAEKLAANQAASSKTRF